MSKSNLRVIDKAMVTWLGPFQGQSSIKSRSVGGVVKVGDLWLVSLVTAVLGATEVAVHALPHSGQGVIVDTLTAV